VSTVDGNDAEGALLDGERPGDTRRSPGAYADYGRSAAFRRRATSITSASTQSALVPCGPAVKRSPQEGQRRGVVGPPGVVGTCRLTREFEPFAAGFFWRLILCTQCEHPDKRNQRGELERSNG
jgi:hypothetical protein